MGCVTCEVRSEIIKWNKEELQEIDKKSRKTMTMNKELHPRSDVVRTFVPRKKGGRGLSEERGEQLELVCEK